MSAIRALGPVPYRIRTLFLSDLHLGSRHCQPEALADFLRAVRCERMYLVGDIVDLWWLAQRRSAWTRAHTAVLDALRQHAVDGAELIYIPGNHDRTMRQFVGLGLPSATVRRRVVHVTADGRRLLVTHGDEFDAATSLGNLAERVGDRIYDWILEGNRLLNRARRGLGLRYWSLADFLKRRSGAAERYIERFVAACIADVRRRGLDGIVCGHIHRAALLERDGIVYANDGDWVESLTALAERRDGTLELVRWNGHVETLATREAALPIGLAA